MSLQCPNVEIVNKVPKLPWTSLDSTTLTRAKSVCNDRYGSRGNPCLVRFTKSNFNTYQALCGAKRQL